MYIFWTEKEREEYNRTGIAPGDKETEENEENEKHEVGTKGITMLLLTIPTCLVFILIFLLICVALIGGCKGQSLPTFKEAPYTKQLRERAERLEDYVHRKADKYEHVTVKTRVIFQGCLSIQFNINGYISTQSVWNYYCNPQTIDSLFDYALKKYRETT